MSPLNIKAVGMGATVNGASEAAPTLFEGLGAFLAREFPPITAYAEGLLSDEGGGWIAGEEKLGKTYYALEEALCLALGLPICGRFTVPTRRRVMFVEEEDLPRRTHTRMRALLRGHDLDPDDAAVRADLDQWFRIAVWRGITLDDTGAVAELTNAIAEFKPEVVYLDVLRKLTIKDLNKQVDAGSVLAILAELRRAHGVLCRVLHHYRKGQGFRTGRGSQEIGGSYVLGAWGENSLFFEPVGRKPDAPVRVAVQFKDGAPVPGFLLVIESEGPAFAPSLVRLKADTETAGTDATAEMDDAVEQAVATLPPVPPSKGKGKEHERPGVPREAVEQALGKAERTVRRALDRLQDAGRILVTGKIARGKKLYGIKVKKSADIDPGHGSGDRA